MSNPVSRAHRPTELPWGQAGGAAVSGVPKGPPIPPVPKGAHGPLHPSPSWCLLLRPQCGGLSPALLLTLCIASCPAPQSVCPCDSCPPQQVPPDLTRPHRVSHHFLHGLQTLLLAWGVCQAPATSQLPWPAALWSLCATEQAGVWGGVGGGLGPPWESLQLKSWRPGPEVPRGGVPWGLLLVLCGLIQNRRPQQTLWEPRHC